MAAEAFKRATGLSSSGSSDASSLAFSKSNVDRIVSRLSLMRGAALKMGQMLSIQDNKLLSPEIETIFRRVQDSANYMPQWQLESVLHKELGQDWLSRFSSFDMIPIAAASIGQVHKAQLITGEHVAVKVQYPGVADSIASDLANLKSLLLVGNLLPRGLYLDNTIRVAQLELGWECDYLREAQASDRFAESIARAGIRGFHVPKVFHDHTTARVLTSEFVDGVPMDKTASLDQQSRNRLGDRLFRLCLSELFTFRFMQTDPNWSNFLYDAKRDRINLIDFGASREFPKAFTDDYLRLLHASSIRDRDGCIHWSRKLGFLTGFESETMNNAHVTSLQNLSRPFMADAEATYDFSNASELASQVRSAIPVMLRERLTPPPDESYSLHRKLSGCFLLCTHLRAQIPCKSIFQDTFRAYRFDNIEG
ncbi:ABC1 family-domain-containing protein [Entophlyctis helioformis]|nr:ABC1 family-domain-containing protein [Entophlyctis helioformis]